MRAWTPESLYEAKPWCFMALGGATALGMVGWSLIDGYWSVWRGILCLCGAGLAVVGGAIQQLRQDYRARSKWRRETRS